MPFLLNIAPVVWASGERYTVASMDEGLGLVVRRALAHFPRAQRAAKRLLRR